MFAKLRQFFCSHQFDIHQIHRVNAGKVEATCVKCAGVFTAPYGLVLPGRLLSGRRPTEHM